MRIGKFEVVLASTVKKKENLCIEITQILKLIGMLANFAKRLRVKKEHN